VISAEHSVLDTDQHQYRHSNHKIEVPFNVEPEDLDAIIIFSIDRLFSSVELFPLVDIFSASITSPGG
jgi:hypothetical protein